MDESGWEYKDISSKTFCLSVPKKFVGEPCTVLLISGIKKFYASEGYVTIFSRNFYVSLCRKLSLGNHTVFEKFSGFRSFYGLKWVSRLFVENCFWSHSAEKFRRGTL